MKRPILAYLIIAALIFMVSASMVTVLGDARPEARLMGEWKEVAWTYEKVDQTNPDVGTKATLSEELRNEITKGMVIHESETWRFERGSALVLQKNGARNDTLQWKLKGYGHMLELVFGDNHQEVYNVRELKDDELVLQFNNDMIARGVVKIVLKRVNDNA